MKDGSLYVFEGEFMVSGSVGPLCPVAIFPGLKGERLPLTAITIAPLTSWLFYVKNESKDVNGK